MIYIPEINSTNEFLKDLVSNKKVKVGQIVCTDFQTSGKGMYHNTWHASDADNILMSIYLQPQSIVLDNLFSIQRWISMIVAESVDKILLQNNIEDTTSIKWPNDIILKNKKIGGILVENTIRGTSIDSSIIGLGININECNFPKDLTKASSLKLLFPHIAWNRIEILQNMLTLLESSYRSNPFFLDKFSITNYQKKLFKINQNAYFILNGNKIMGVIEGIDSDGKLRVKLENYESKSFDLKELTLLY